MNQNLECKDLIHKGEKKYFILSLIASIIIYLSLAFCAKEGLAFLLFLFVFFLFYNGIILALIRLNGVLIGPNQFPEVYDRVEEVCELLHINKVPDIYVIQSGGVLNAFATKFARKNMIVIYSEIFDLINSDDKEVLTFVIAHELAHIKCKHIVKQSIILPAMLIPSLGKAYSRACEYTCDRIAANCISNLEAALDGLTLLAMGKTLYKKVNRNEYLLQSSMEKGLFVTLAENSSTHPSLPRRINEIQLFFSDSSSLVNFSTKGKKLTRVFAGVLFLLFAIAGTGFLYVDSILNIVDSFIANNYSQGGISEITTAVAEGDVTKVKELLNSGVNPDIQDPDGWTPLMWAAQDDNISMINLLTKAGADPNLVDYYEDTALLLAIYENNVDAIRTLISVGADPNMADSTKYTPLMAAVTNENIESVKVLLELGANPNLKDEDNFTAFLYAKKYGYNEIADLLKP